MSQQYRLRPRYQSSLINLQEMKIIFLKKSSKNESLVHNHWEPSISIAIVAPVFPPIKIRMKQRF